MLTSARLVTWRREVPLKPCWANSSSAAPRMRSLVENWELAIGSPEDESNACLLLVRGRRRQKTQAAKPDASLPTFGSHTPNNSGMSEKRVAKEGLLMVGNREFPK